jgi:hypothetical protein
VHLLHCTMRDIGGRSIWIKAEMVRRTRIFSEQWRRILGGAGSTATLFCNLFTLINS